MAYEPKTERLDLGDGDYAVLQVELKHKTERDVGAVMKKYIKASEPIRIQIPDNGNVQAATGDLTAQAKQAQPKILGELEIDFANADFYAAANIMILYQVKEWSFGAVTQEVLDNMLTRKRDIITKRFDELFPFPQGGGGN